MPTPARFQRTNTLPPEGSPTGKPLWQERLDELKRKNNEAFVRMRSTDKRASPKSWLESAGDADVRHAIKGERRQAGNRSRDEMRYVGDEGRRVTAPAGATTTLRNGRVVNDDLVLRTQGVTAEDLAMSKRSNENFFTDAQVQDLIEKQRTGKTALTVAKK